MPQVPSLPGRQIRTRPLPAARRTAAPTPQSLGAGLGVVIARFGARTVQDIIQEERQKADELAFLRSTNELSRWGGKELYDPESGLLTIEGEESLGLVERYSASHNDIAARIAETLSNDRQRIRFENYRQNHKQAGEMELRRHTFTQMRRFDDTETQAGVDTRLQLAIEHADDPAAVSKLMGEGVAIIQGHARRRDIGKDETDRRVFAFRSGVHVGVVSRLIDRGQDRKAKLYFDTVTCRAEDSPEGCVNEIDGRQLGQLEKQLDEGTTRGEAQRMTDDIMRQAESVPEAREMARAVTDPRVRDEVVTRVNRRIREEEDSTRDVDRQRMVDAGNAIDKAIEAGASDPIDAVAPSDWIDMTPGQHVALENYATRKKDGTLTTVRSTYYRLMVQAGDDPETFARVNLMNHHQDLDDGDFERLSSMQVAIKNGERRTSIPVLASFDDIRAAANAALVSYGYNTSMTESNGDRETVAFMYRLLEDRVKIAEAAVPGKKFTRREIQEIADDILSEDITVPGAGFEAFTGFGFGLFNAKTIFARDELAIEVTFSDIPSGEVQLIEEKLRAAGIPVNERMVLQAFVNQQLRERNAKRPRPPR